MNTDVLSNFVDNLNEKDIADISSNYDIPGVGSFKFTFFDASYLKDGIEFFRPIIRGFITLLLLFYNYRQVLSFIGQDPTIAHNAMENYNEHKGGGE